MVFSSERARVRVTAGSSCCCYTGLRRSRLTWPQAPWKGACCAGRGWWYTLARALTSEVKAHTQRRHVVWWRAPGALRMQYSQQRMCPPRALARMGAQTHEQPHSRGVRKTGRQTLVGCLGRVVWCGGTRQRGCCAPAQGRGGAQGRALDIVALPDAGSGWLSDASPHGCVFDGVRFSLSWPGHGACHTDRPVTPWAVAGATPGPWQLGRRRRCHGRAGLP